MNPFPIPKVDHFRRSAPVQVLQDHRDEFANGAEAIGFGFVGQQSSPFVSEEHDTKDRIHVGDVIRNFGAQSAAD